ncbi:nickel-binding protein [Carboxylicivirga sp. M1479]|uniref:nickel-binding protein n=1 Tax=Carboxylicivirga sp. M1479 TaxID=2594476 RepID=UPI0011779C2B|nr:nickel-binding protein [Carboxylicivirga sp. M1479]TRX71452.1 DUF4242 domain-containing protein [Carboxylicivirga sp. M1479]
MPIYMDRHDLPGVTAKDVAKAHKQDLKVQDQFDCKAITYWFDEARQTAFCLIEAPSKEAVEKMHDCAHGLIPNEIIEVNTKVVESFLGRIEDPVVANKEEPLILNEPAFRVIMALNLWYADSIYSEVEIDRVRKSQRIHNDIIGQTLLKFEGREAEHNHDVLLCSFTSVPQAVMCALDIQRKSIAYNSSAGTNVHIQIGLSAGSPVIESNEFFGQTIQMARHLCYLSTDDCIMVSNSVAEYCRKDSINLLYNVDYARIFGRLDEQFINHLLQILDIYWKTEDFSLRVLAKKMGVSKSMLYRKVIALTGLSPNDFVREFKLYKTLKLIEKQASNISEIAYGAGFSSPSYFSKCFKNYYGIVPSFYSNYVHQAL